MLEYDNGQMQERYVHYDAMKIYACAMHDMNAFTDTRARKIISSYLRIRGCGAPCVQFKKVIWIFRLPMTKDETNIQRVCDDMM